MKSPKGDLLLPAGYNRRHHANRFPVAFYCGALMIVVWLLWGRWPSLKFYHSDLWSGSANDYGSLSTSVNWTTCGDKPDVFSGFQCANITVPLDYSDAEDRRAVTIAVTRYLATDKDNRQGAIFLNPGGPGGSGTASIYTRGSTLAKVFNGQFDLIGFDPRGINLTQPYVSCFESKLDQDIFFTTHDNFQLNSPVNTSAFPDAERDITRQLQNTQAAYRSISSTCRRRTGEAMAYMGTDYVVRDIDFLAKLIEGEDKPINYWGFSYGTLIGQYMVKILPPERLGRIIIDGVVNADIWNGYADNALDQGFLDTEQLLEGFASTCSATKNTSRCALADLTPEDIIAHIDGLIDSLYKTPQPILDLGVPAVATAASVRRILFQDMYRHQTWPSLAEHLHEAIFAANYTGIGNATLPRVDKDTINQADTSAFAGDYIYCADAKPYDASHPEPSAAALASRLLDIRSKQGPHFDPFISFALCTSHDAPQGTAPLRHAGNFTLPDDTLSTPILILSNTYDPVTPLAHAVLAKDRLGNNARLVEQRSGYGHCALSAASVCTAQRVRDYMTKGKIGDDDHVLCEVEERPFEQFEATSAVVENAEDRELMAAWRDLGDLARSDSY